MYLLLTHIVTALAELQLQEITWLYLGAFISILVCSLQTPLTSHMAPYPRVTYGVVSSC